MCYILDGVRPKKPIFIITRGYTKELWEMTTSCWEEDPTKRPAVEYVLGVLSRAAERWEPKYGELAAQDDTEELDSEHEEKPDITSVSTTIDSPQPPVIEAPRALDPIPAPSVLPNDTPPKYVSVTPLKKGEVKPAPVGPSNEEELKSTLAISRREEMKPASVSPSEAVREEQKSTPVISKKERTREDVPTARSHQNSTHLRDKSTLPLVSKSITTASASVDQPHQRPIIETPIRAPAYLTPTPTPYVSTHSTVKDEAPPEYTSTASSKKEEIKPAPFRPPTSKELMPLDGMADQLLARAESSSGEDGVQEVAEALEKVGRKHLPPTDRCIRLTENRCWNPTAKSAHV